MRLHRRREGTVKRPAHVGADGNEGEKGEEGRGGGETAGEGGLRKNPIQRSVGQGRPKGCQPKILGLSCGTPAPSLLGLVPSSSFLLSSSVVRTRSRKRASEIQLPLRRLASSAKKSARRITFPT